MSLARNALGRLRAERAPRAAPEPSPVDDELLSAADGYAVPEGAGACSEQVLIAREFAVWGRPVRLLQDPTGLWAGGLGSTLWDASIAVLRFVDEQLDAAQTEGKRGIELGAGTGLAGLALAAAGVSMVLTDVAATLPILQRNADANEGLAAAAAEYAWGGPWEGADAFDWVVAADVVYDPATHEALLAALRRFCGPGTRALLGYEPRKPEDARFFEMLDEHFERRAALRMDDITVYELRLRLRGGGGGGSAVPERD